MTHPAPPRGRRLLLAGAAATAVVTGTGIVAGTWQADKDTSTAPRTDRPDVVRDEPMSPAQDRGCSVSRVVRDPYLTETVTLRCGAHEWAAERVAGRTAFTVTTAEADGWTLTGVSTGPLVSGDGPTGVVVVLDLTRGGATCDISANYTRGSGEDSPAVTYQDECLRFGGTEGGAVRA